MTFSFDSLDNAAQAYQKLAQRIAALSKEGQPDVEAARPYQEQFQAALGNDLNTSLGADRAVRRAESGPLRRHQAVPHRGL